MGSVMLLSLVGPAATATAATTHSTTHSTAPTLTGWRLTLPVDSDGGTGGDAAVLDPATLDPPYLSRADDGSLEFWAPTDGASTSHSDGTVHVKVNQQEASGGNYQDYPLLADVGIGTTFAYRITDNGDGTMRFTATYQGSTQQQTADVPSVWSGAGVRFQAGDYEQLKGDPSDGDGGRMTFAALTVS